MSCISTYYAIDNSDWSVYTWVGMHLEKWTVLSQFCLMFGQMYCRYWSLYRVRKIIARMIVTTTISPSLKIGLRLLGMWPGVSYSVVYWLMFMLSLLIIQYFQYLYVISHFKMSELSNLVDSLPLTLDYTLTLFKMTNFWIYRR